jgi:hypothetical protein
VILDEAQALMALGRRRMPAAADGNYHDAGNGQHNKKQAQPGAEFNQSQ